MSNKEIYSAVTKQIANYFRHETRELQHLDIGSGSGDLVENLKKYLKTSASCCDYTDRLMKLPNQKVEIINLNKEKELPYHSDKFDIVTLTEVIEHLEDFRAILREVYRVLKHGGICVLSTPNILNLISRFRNLWFGFAHLMGPLPVSNRAIESLSGHINPISLFYIIHALYEIGFCEIDFTIDKYQRSGIGKAVIFLLPIKIFGSLIWRKEVQKYETMDDSIMKLVPELNSLRVLFGRTVIVSAIKK